MQKLLKGLSPQEQQQLTAVIAYATEMHRGQRRKGRHGEPYINHCLRVASTLSTDGGYNDVVLLSAAILHDTIEDTPATVDDINERFGALIAKVVAEVTDDDRLPYQARRAQQSERAATLSSRAKLVRLADKIDNVRDILQRPPSWGIERRQDYVRWASQVIAGLRGIDAVLEAIFDQAVLEVSAALAAPESP